MLKPHPAAELFPLMTGAEFDALVADIKAHGQREPIVTTDGLILDGRNRARACEALGLEPAAKEWDRQGTAQAFVISHNLHRRHLNEPQRAAIAARLLTLKPAQRARDAVAQVLKSTSEPAAVFTAQQAADLLNIGRNTVMAAKKIIDCGTREEIAALDAGQIGAQTVADQIRAKKTPSERKAERSIPANQRGASPDRIQRQRERAEIWRRFRDALDNLTGLPLPEDIFSIVREMDKAKITGKKLPRAIAWLKEFEQKWTARS